MNWKYECEQQRTWNEDQNNVNLSLDDSNQPFACNRHLEPRFDMVFDNLEAARAYYNAYARWKGFSIWVNYTRKNKDKILIGTEYVCLKEGFHRQCNGDNERIGLKHTETRVGCKAMIGLKKVDDTWIVCKFVEGHNHELLTPKSTSLLRGHRVITSALLGHMWFMLGIYVNVELANPLTKRTILVIG